MSFHTAPHLQPELCPAPVTPLGVVPEETMPETDQKTENWSTAGNRWTIYEVCPVTSPLYLASLINLGLSGIDYLMSSLDYILPF
jgi:hypothetical protein